MKLFGQIIRTLVNVAELPVEAAKDVFTLGGVALDRKKTFTREQLEKIKNEAGEDSQP